MRRKELTLILTTLLFATTSASCNAEDTARIDTTPEPIPSKLVDLPERLNSESPTSNFVVETSNSGGLALYSEQGNGLWQYGELREEENSWFLGAYTLEGEYVEVEIDTLSAVEEAQGLLTVDVDGDKEPDITLAPHITVPVFP